jgi:formylglycine-generating enzyme required for sulfatase activity/predicted Ser/Thr protein kinase
MQMAQNEGQNAGDSRQKRSQATSSFSAGKRASTGLKDSLIDTEVLRGNGPTDLPAEFGRYRVKQKLGGGGMGTVYLVENTELEREEALKVPHFSDGDDLEVRERFLREAKSAAKLDHANLCPVYDAGVHDGVYYLTMRFLKGKLLSDYTGKAQPARKAVEIVAKLAQALESAHAKGVIHRDLKPGNVMMVNGAVPVVMDFGLAKQVQRADQKLTQFGSRLGTPAYMPPEQVKGNLEQIGPASDIYSLGVILYELLTGRLPFEGTVEAIYGQIPYVEPPMPSALVPGLNPTLDGICRKAMAKASTERYPSMKAFAAVLLEYLRSTPAAQGAGNLALTAVDKTDVFQATTVAPGRRPAGNSDVFQKATVPPRARRPVPPTPRPGQAPTEYRPTGGTRKPSKKPGATKGGEETSRRHFPIGIAATVAVALLTMAFGGLWAAGVIRLRTSEGILVVEVNEPNSDVFVDGEQVTVTWDAGGHKAEIAVKPGTHEVEVKKDGFTAAGENVTLSDGGRKVLTASLRRLSPHEPPAKPDIAKPPVIAKPDIPKPEVVERPQETTAGPQQKPEESTPKPVPGDPPSAPPVVAGMLPQPLDCTGATGAQPDVVRGTQEAWAKYLGRNVEEKVEIANGVAITFVLVPPGKFLMGSPPEEKGKGGRYPNEVIHEVTLTKPFEVGKYELTQAQYAALTGNSPSLYKGPDRPVEQVTWNEADAFGRELTKKLADGYEYRLLTEAEWEYSCRGGRPVSLAFGVGDGRVLTTRDANFDNAVRETSKVGSYAANALGLCDMHGNLWEWCADWNEPYPTEPATDPLRTTGGPFRVARGGCHNEPAPECRSALRQGSPEARRDCWMGFRLARTLPLTPLAVGQSRQPSPADAVTLAPTAPGLPGSPGSPGSPPMPPSQRLPGAVIPGQAPPPPGQPGAAVVASQPPLPDLANDPKIQALVKLEWKEGLQKIRKRAMGMDTNGARVLKSREPRILLQKLADKYNLEVEQVKLIVNTK